MLHNGRPNRSARTRRTVVVNFGRRSTGVWPGYAPQPATLAAASARQREILASDARTWDEEAMWSLGFTELTAPTSAPGPAMAEGR